MFFLKYAHKNLKRHPKRTLILITAIILTTTFVIWLLSLARSSTNQITNQITSAFSGRYTLTHKGFYASDDYRKLNFYKTINLRKIPKAKLKELTKRVFFPVFASGEKKTSGVLLVGIEAQKEKKLNQFWQSIIKGKYEIPKNKKQILIGENLAKKLQVNIGDEIPLIGQGQRGAIANDLFTISGIFSFGGAEIEEKIIMTDIRSAQEFGEMSYSRVHALISFSDQDTKLDKTLSKVSWEDLLTDVALTINFTKEMTQFLTSLFIMIVCIGLSNTILLSFFERRKEIGTLKTLGANSRWISLSMVYEVIVMGFIGILIGNYLGYFLIEFFNINPINLKIFSGGQDLLLGDIVLNPEIKLLHHPDFHLRSSLTILFFLSIAMIYPITYTLKRSKDVI